MVVILRSLGVGGTEFGLSACSPDKISSMKKPAVLLLVLTLGLFAPSASALTWQQVLNFASEHSHQIKSAKNQLEAYRWTYYKSYSSYLPQVSASMSTGNSSSSPSTAYGLTATQSLFSGLSNYYNLQSAYKNYENYMANVKNTESDVFYNTRAAFIDLFIAEQNVVVLKNILTHRNENARMLKLFYDSGKEDKGNYLRTMAQKTEAEYNLASAKRSVELARLELSQIIETDVSSVEADTEVKPILNVDFDFLVKESPSYIMAKYTLDIAEITNKSTLSEFLPNISLQGSYQKSGTSWPPSTSNKSLALNLSYSFFPGGSNIADIKINSFNLDKAEQDFFNTAKDLKYNIKEAYKNLCDAIDSYNVQKIYLNSSLERARIAQAKYMNGLMSYDEWDRTQNEYINYQKSVLTYNKLALLAEAQWYKTYGGHVK